MDNKNSIFESLVAERDRIIMKYLCGDFADFKTLREICKCFNNEQGIEVIKTSGTDQELWRSVSDYFLELRKSHD